MTREPLSPTSEGDRFEALCRAIFLAADHLMIATAPDGTILDLNPAAERALGWRRDELVGRETPLVFHDPDEIEAQGRVLSAQLGRPIGGFAVFLARPQEGVTEEREWTYVRKDGSRFAVVLTVSELRDREGRGLGYVGIAKDVSADHRLQEAELALTDSVERFDRLAANLPGIVYQRLLRPDGAVRHTYVSAGLKSVLGYEPRDLMDSPQLFWRMVHSDDLPSLVAALHGAATTRGTADLVYRALTADGEVRWLHSIAHPNILPDGSVLWDGLALDITESRLATEKQRRTEQALELAQRMEALGQMAGGLAHEFNNLLMPIMGLTELALQSLPDDAPARQNLGHVLEAARRAAGLTRRILNFGRYDLPSGVPQPLAAALADGLQMIRAVVPTSVSIHAHLTDHTVLTRLDSGEAQQILVNLAANAAFALQGRGGHLWINLDEFDGYARLVVRDDGLGMDGETMKRIFEPFYTTKPVGEGTGLGLAVVHSIVTSHAGSISVDSTPGSGTTFTILLPLAGNKQKAAGGPAA
jgi:PAS domain S-box-containing protein